jgi:hypothetical protein
MTSRLSTSNFKWDKIGVGIYAYSNKFYVFSPSYLGSFESLEEAQEARNLALEQTKEARKARRNACKELRHELGFTEPTPQGGEVKVEPGIYRRNGLYIVRSPVYLGAFPTLHAAQQARIRAQHKGEKPPEPENDVERVTVGTTISRDKKTREVFDLYYKKIYLGQVSSDYGAKLMLAAARAVYSHLRPDKPKPKSKIKLKLNAATKTKREVRVETGIYKDRASGAYLVRSPKYLGSFETLQEAQEARTEHLASKLP